MTTRACHAMPSPGHHADTSAPVAPALPQRAHTPRLHAARNIVATDTSRVASVSVTDHPEQAGKTVQLDAFNLLFARSVPPSNPNATDAMATTTRGPQRAAIELSEGVRQLCEADSRLACVCPHGTPPMVSVFAA